MMPLQMLFTSFLYGLVISNLFVSTVATPVRRDVPDALRPRQSAATPHPLDYAPDFSKDPFPPWPNSTMMMALTSPQQIGAEQNFLAGRAVIKMSRTSSSKRCNNSIDWHNKKLYGKKLTGTRKRPRRFGAMAPATKRFSIM